MVSEDWPNARRRRNIAKMRLPEFAEPTTDLRVLTAIPDALKLRAPDSPEHAVEFLFGRRLALDVAVVLAVVCE
jgi:hypothetical protein